MLEKWIEHHEAIVGSDGLIIMDNCSSNAKTLHIYDSRPDVMVVKFQGFHNDIHCYRKYPSLYESIRESASCYTVLDTDELLVYFDGLRFLRGASILNSVRSNQFDTFIPATWLYNSFYLEDTFMCGTDMSKLHHGISWGKPIVSSKLSSFPEMINHNTQINSKSAAPSPCPGYFVLHMANLSPEQRINSNREKLIARKFVPPDASINDILSKNQQGATYNEILYVEEIRKLTSETDRQSNPGLKSGELRILPDGFVKYASTAEQRILLRFYEGFEAQCQRAFG